MLKQVSIKTGARTEMQVIDHRIEEAIAESGVKEGLCIIWVPHTTAGVTVNENADPDVVRDILYETEKMVPFVDGYHHGEGNSAAHIKSSLFGPSLTLVITGSKPLLGRWQSVYFCEFDGPRSRTIYLKLLEV